MFYSINQLKHLIVSQCETIENCLRILDDGSRPTLFIINKNQEIIGTVTDGDIRRALLKGVSITDVISKAMNSRFIAAKENENNQIRNLRMRERDIRYLPILNDEQHITGFEVNHHGQESLPNKAILMCGGLGTRMGDLTKDCPKPMLPIGDTPMLEIILSRLAMQGIRHFYLAINYLGTIIEKHFGNGEKWGVDIEYLREKKRLGTGGAISLLSETPKNAMIVMNGDILTDFDVRDIISFHTRENSFATMGIVEYQYQNPFGVVCHQENTFIKIIEKPIQTFKINAGIYVVDPSIVALIPKNKFIDMPDILVKAKSIGKSVNVFQINENWSDIGRKDDYLSVQES
ncbi:MAG: nucleotidyltransferase family protein [Bacteroidales bacterium]|nr:nucleotidyltransferase family protein [Bacteroidales bacterium]